MSLLSVGDREKNVHRNNSNNDCAVGVVKKKKICLDYDKDGR